MQPYVPLSVKYHLHGLRHTFASVANAIEVPHYHLQLLLNHAPPKNDVTGGYIHRDIESLRRSQERISAELLRLCAAGEKVVSLRPRRKQTTA